MKTLEQLEAKYKELGAEIEKLKQEKEQAKTGRWKPKYGEVYWSIDREGDITKETWGDDCYDNKCYSINNVFHTKEEAEFAIERTKVMRELDYLSDGGNWMMHYNGDKHEICYHYSGEDMQGPLKGFSSRQKLNETVYTIGIDRLKKYYFMVH